MDKDIKEYLDKHYIHRGNWLRAAVLGANDGILSTASVAISVASANTSNDNLVLATIAALVAGALSMAAGEYVSVSSQTDLENADIDREAEELRSDPEGEMEILTKIYVQRGLSIATAELVASELTKHDALEAHTRDELGIDKNNRVNPLQAALASGLSFTGGGLLPFLTVLVFPPSTVKWLLYGLTIIFLAILGGVSAKTGGSNVQKSIIRVVFWGSIAMGISALVGYLFGVGI